MVDLSLIKYSDTEIKSLLKSIVVLHDSREQQNSHILDLFDNHKINHKKMKLDFGDYSFMLPAVPELGIDRDIYFNRKIVIERKACLEEISNNLSNARTEFENEFMRASRSDCKTILLIENGSFEDISKHNYKTEFNEKSFLGSLLSFSHRYNLTINFISKPYAGIYIYQTFYYYLREFLKA